MKLESCGHAFWIVHCETARIIFDPVLSDPFEQGTVTACPARTFFTEIPDYDIIYISHRHLDHFHIPTLKQLKKDVPILIPNDELTILSIQQLGFTNIQIMTPFTPYTIEGEKSTLSLYPTPSVSDVFMEYGLLVVEKTQEGTTTLFNQVDTPLSDACIKKLHSLAPNIDVHLAMYASQDFGWFHGQSSELSQTYTQNLYAAQQVGAKTIIPAAAGFRFVDRYQFLNQLLFPISTERFIADIQALCIESECFAVHPGDTITVTTQSVTHQKQASDFVAMKEDDTHLLSYDPMTPIPSLVDHNITGYPLAHLHGFVQAVIEQGFVAYLQGAIGQKEEEVSQYTQNHASYLLSVVFPDTTKQWKFSFSSDGFTLDKGAQIMSCDALWKISASALLDLCEGKKSCWAIRPDSRKWSQLFRPKQTPVGLRTFEVDLPDLLTHFILNMRIRMKGEKQAMLEYYGLC